MLPPDTDPEELRAYLMAHELAEAARISTRETVETMEAQQS
jgi:hypothetical protein